MQHSRKVMIDIHFDTRNGFLTVIATENYTVLAELKTVANDVSELEPITSKIFGEAISKAVTNLILIS